MLDLDDPFFFLSEQNTTAMFGSVCLHILGTLGARSKVNTLLLQQSFTVWAF